MMGDPTVTVFFDGGNGVDVSAAPQSVTAFADKIVRSGLQHKLAAQLGRPVSAADFDLWLVQRAAYVTLDDESLSPDEKAAIVRDPSRFRKLLSTDYIAEGMLDGFVVDVQLAGAYLTQLPLVTHA
jgi:hypothetical protein